jgi:hypothetical protein
VFPFRLALTQVSAATVTFTNGTNCAAATNETTVETFSFDTACYTQADSNNTFTFSCNNGAGTIKVFLGKDGCAVNSTEVADATLATSGTACSADSVVVNNQTWYASVAGCVAADTSSSTGASSSSTGTGAASSLSAPALLLAVLAVLARLSL